MKTVLFIPGYPEDLESRDYASTIGMIKERGYEVVFVPIKWRYATIENWVDELMAVYDKYKPENTILAGFSYGAMTAFVASSKRNPSELWLFSLSGFFREDINSKDMKKGWLNDIGHRRVAAFEKLDYQKIARDITCKTLLFAGANEMDLWPTMKYRTNQAPKYLKNSKLTIIEGVGHDVTDELYIAAIKDLI